MAVTDTACPECGKTGYKDGEICETCFGQGILPVMYPSSFMFKYILDAASKAELARIVAETLQVKVDNLLTGILIRFPTSKILEATDSDEYMALDANKKAWYNLFISAGTLDMTEGTKARDLFLAWIFPPGKISHDAILAALS